MMTRALWVGAVVLILASVRVEASPIGDWVLSDGSAVVRIEAQGTNYTARIVRLLRPEFAIIDGEGSPGAPRVDIHNPDRALQQRSLLGLEIAFDLQAEGEQLKGRIYDPTSGKTYRCRIALRGDEYLEVRGFIGFSALGRSMYWQRLDSYTAQMRSLLGF